MRDSLVDTPVTVGVRVLDIEYQVSCAEDEVDELIESARDLDDQMQQIRKSGKVFGLNRIAIMAALNIAHGNLRLRRRMAGADRDLGKLAERIGRVVETREADVGD